MAENRYNFQKLTPINQADINAYMEALNYVFENSDIKNVGVSERNGILTITADTMADITLEKGLFLHKADVFEEVFGIRPVLKQKRTGKRG